MNLSKKGVGYSVGSTRFPSRSRRKMSVWLRLLGQCPGVGAAGVTLGGGLGWLSELHGASCGSLLSARMVNADGRILSVDA
jgi:FAD/FMN-containing dehydrogenase